jgi:monofunctional biosynthetic peptidoglycan transglycosylase
MALGLSQTVQATPPEETPHMQVLFEFDEPTTTWSIIDDGVMGGLSRGRWQVAEGTGVFQGELSLENNGGFSSVRSDPLDKAPAGATGFRLRVKGDGRRYQFRVRTDGNFDGVSYRAEFVTTKDAWQEVTLELKEFAPVFRGNVLKDYPALSADRVVTVGFLLADKTPGSFRLEVDWIGAVDPEKSSGVR